ncbi:MAG: hypothetical protein H6538_01055 [Bacteroidales bacterium]|nr:hypothetical protein [Bacteroidales bacterium]MCB9012630.1 hypothetical protein [Bacteroidales bacterium]
MIKKFIFGSILFLSLGIANAQVSSVGATNVVINLNDNPAWSRVFVTDRPTVSNSMSGTPFINNDWQLADIVVSDDKGEIKAVPCRIDAKANLIEINQGGVVKVLHSMNTKSIAFKTTNEVFITNKTLGIPDPVGFYKVIYDSKSSLLCYYSTKTIEGAYNPVLDAGIKEDKLVVEKTYYIFRDGKLTRLENKRGKLVKQFSDQPEIAEYIKENRITPNEELDLMKLITFIDSKS